MKRVYIVSRMESIKSGFPDRSIQNNVLDTTKDNSIKLRPLLFTEHSEAHLHSCIFSATVLITSDRCMSYWNIYLKVWTCRCNTSTERNIHNKQTCVHWSYPCVWHPLDIYLRKHPSMALLRRNEKTVTRWHVFFQSSACSNGSYGLGCMSTCGNCSHGDVCDKVNGTCPNGCQPGFESSNRLCNEGK